MFGAITAIILIIYAIYRAINNSIEDYRGMSQYRNDKFHTYIDHDGLSRDIKTGKYRSITRDNNGDIYIWGKDIGSINYSQDERDKEYWEYKKRYDKGEVLNRTAVYWKPSPTYDTSKKVNILGKRYKDLSTGNIIIVREHNYKMYYVALDTLEVLRYTDSYTKMEKESNIYSKEKEIEDVKDFQCLINSQLADYEYIGDPTKGKSSFIVTSRLEDYWKE